MILLQLRYFRLNRYIFTTKRTLFRHSYVQFFPFVWVQGNCVLDLELAFIEVVEAVIDFGQFAEGVTEKASFLVFDRCFVL
jgi:hypothetical protein